MDEGRENTDEVNWEKAVFIAGNPFDLKEQMFNWMKVHSPIIQRSETKAFPQKNGDMKIEIRYIRVTTN